MGIFDSLGKALGVGKELSVDDFMSAQDAEEVDVLHKAADFYVKPVKLMQDSDVKLVEEELKLKNIILLNITAVARNPAKLKAAVGQLKRYTESINGDMARIDEDKILLTPHNVKIVKKRQ